MIYINNLKFIKKFILGQAQYLVGDGNGEEVLLKIDYEKNKFSILDTGKKNNKNLQNEARKVAEELLERKHGVNFANKLLSS